MARSSNQQDDEKRRALLSLLDAPSFGGGLLDEPGVVRAYSAPPPFSQSFNGNAVNVPLTAIQTARLPPMYEALRAANNAPAFVPLPNYTPPVPSSSYWPIDVLVPTHTTMDSVILSQRVQPSQPAPYYGPPPAAPAAPAYQAPRGAPMYQAPNDVVAYQDQPVLMPAVMPVDYVNPASAPMTYGAPVSFGDVSYGGEGGDSGGSVGQGPSGAAGTGDFADDAANAAEAMGPAMAGAALGAAVGGPMGAAAGMVGSTMAQAVAEALGLSTPAEAPPTGFASVIGNVALTAMNRPATSDPLDALAALVAEDPQTVSTEDLADVTGPAPDRAMSEAETQDESGVAPGEASQADDSGEGEGDGDGSGDGDSGDGGAGAGDGAGDGGGSGDGGSGGGDGGYRRGGVVRGKKGKAVKATVHGGEYVLRGEAVNKYGRKALDALNERRVPKGRVAGLLG